MFRLGLLALLSTALIAQQPQALGIFDGQNDLGGVLHPGSAEYDASTKTYTITGSGDNMWFNKDEFHFVWKKISAEDLMLTADLSILSADGNAHRKAVLMIRQTLDPDSAYADVARHGEGLTSLQFRERKGATTHEIESKLSGPTKLRIEKLGQHFYMWIGNSNGEMEFAGGSAWVDIGDSFYVGIGVCSHDKDAEAKAAFSNVELETTFKRAKLKAKFSTVETVMLSGDARTAAVSPKHVLSPGWSADGKTVTYEADGHDEQAPFEPLRTATPIGAPLPAQTGSGFSYYAIKTGDAMQIWRRSADGSQAVQFTSDDMNNTSPRVSPDGKYMVFLSYSKEYAKLSADVPVELRLMQLSDNTVKTLATFVGGPSSLGENPWSPDGRRLVFVSYQVMK
jgi:hypothetical protein